MRPRDVSSRWQTISHDTSRCGTAVEFGGKSGYPWLWVRLPNVCGLHRLDLFSSPQKSFWVNSWLKKALWWQNHPYYTSQGDVGLMLLLVLTHNKKIISFAFGSTYPNPDPKDCLSKFSLDQKTKWLTKKKTVTVQLKTAKGCSSAPRITTV